MLWSLGELEYLVIECKSASTADSIWRHDAEQLSHSIDWFCEKYDHTCNGIPVMIHNTNALDKRASARPGARVITFDKLGKLRDAISKYAAALAADNDYRDAGKISAQLATWSLNSKSFLQRWSVSPRKP